MYNKKATDWWIIGGIIIFVIVAFILIYHTNSVAETTISAEERETCKASVLLKARTKILGEDIDTFKLKCKTNYITLDTNKQEEIEKQIADEMYWCWYQFAQGKADFLSDFDFHGKDLKCYTCSKITFSKKTSELKSIKIESFLNFMNNELTPAQSETYSEFLTGTEGQKIDFGPQKETITLDESTPYYVLFTAKKFDKTWSFEEIKQRSKTTGLLIGGLAAVGGIIFPPLGIGILAATATGAGIGLVTSVAYEAEENSYYLPGFLLLPGEDAAKQCEKLEVLEQSKST